jgi:hypothetical protein
LISRKPSPALTDPMPDTLEALRAELDYWEPRQYDGEPGSSWWEQVRARIEGLRHRENRLLSAQQSVSVTNNLLGPNSRINHNSFDQSENLVTPDRSGELRSDGRDCQLPPVTFAVAAPRRHRTLEFLPDLNPKEIELVVSASRDQDGQIFRVRMAGRERLSVGGQTLLDSNNPRTRAEWIGAIENLVSLGFLEVVGQKREFYQLTDLGYSAADQLGDFSRWSTSQVTIEAHYLNASTETVTTTCSAVIQLPAVYYEYRVRSDTEVMRSEKEPRSLLLEGVDLRALNEIPWQPTDLSFAVGGTNETKSFRVARTDDHRAAKFYITGVA